MVYKTNIVYMCRHIMILSGLGMAVGYVDYNGIQYGLLGDWYSIMYHRRVLVGRKRS